MIVQIEAVDLFLMVNKARKGGSEVPPNSNRGPFVEPALTLVGCKPGDPWCAAEQALCGTLALGARWPLPLTGGCVVLGEFAMKHKILFDAPQRGDLFLLWEKVAGVWRFAHTGACVQQVGTGPWDTSEGNTNGAGSREGWLHWEKQRYFGPKDKFVRWALLLQ